MQDVEWWTLVPSENGSKDVTDADDSLSGPYVWVDEDDIVAGVADTIADVVRTIPSVSKLSNADLQAMLAGTFAELRTKTLYGKIWDYGTLAMSSYSWASYAFSLYKDPSTVLWVLRTLFTVMKYVCVAVIV